jgi:predicted NUDIX family NTP pyrophosphohydrolase
MAVRSAAILLHRRGRPGREVWIAHMGGPFWARKDEGAWGIPKGEYSPGEDPLAAARREFAEETGAAPPAGEAVALGAFRQGSGKIVQAWAVEGEFDPASLKSNTFTMEWPPRSGTMREFPEVDRAGWFGLDEARTRILPAQAPLLDRLAEQG